MSTRIYAAGSVPAFQNSVAEAREREWWQVPTAIQWASRSATLPLFNVYKGARYAAGIRKVTSSHDEAIALFRIGNRADDRSGGEPATIFGDELIGSVQ